jgi:2-phospho-L-lactate/phosphoenolpyruvate guanylyltransferase
MNTERSPSDVTSSAVAVLVPIKDFSDAKFRLADTLSSGQRAAIAKEMARRVVTAAAPHPVYVVCDDEDVATWALAHNAAVITANQPGLNKAVTTGFVHLRGLGYDTVIVSHADLPLASSYDSIADFAGITIVPDRHGGGTNVMAVPTRLDFTFTYGVDSYSLHRAEAERLGEPVRSLAVHNLQWDVDTPLDLHESLGLSALLANETNPP